MTDDPLALFPHPGNRALLAALAAGAAPAEGGAGPWSPGGWILRTHPDLEELLRGRRKPAAVRHAYGFAVLVARGGRVFAVARSMSDLAILLPGDEGRGPAEGLAAEPDLGEGWWRLPAWDASVPASEHGARVEALLETAGRLAAERPATKA